jgi:hypothetical protein
MSIVHCGCVAKFFEISDNTRFLTIEKPMIKDAPFPKEIILYAVFFYVLYFVFYRDLAEIVEERGVLMLIMQS